MNPRLRYTRGLLAAVLIAAGFLGDPLPAQPVAPPLWAQDSIRSEVLGETRHLRISLPVGYDTPQYASERYPVLIVIGSQGDVPFASMVANARALGGTNAPATPRLLVVGVETPGATRFRDLTLPLAGDTAKRADGGGGAPAFLRFLSTELQPYLAARYRTQPFTVLAGHSLAGFFVVWAFGSAPDFVNGALALSPTPDEPERLIDGIAARSAPGRLFLVSGTAEGLDGPARAFAAALNARRIPTLAFEHHRIPDVSHDHTGTMGMVPGLRFVFRPVSLAAYQLEFSGAEPPLAQFTAVFDSTRKAYLRGARELGLPQRLPLSFLTSQRRWYQDTRMAPLLLRLCEELITAYPTLWDGYDCAGDAQGRLGRAAEASASYRRALDMARSAGDSAAVGRLSRKAESRP